MFKCVPLNPSWVGDTKLDLHAIYRRKNGDLCTLPLRRHHQHQVKGFEYVTLADAESFKVAAPFLQQQGLSPQQFICGYDGDGRPTPWNPALYLDEQAEVQKERDADLRALIATHGVEVVEQIRGEKIPAHLLPTTPPAKSNAKAGAAA